MNLKKIIISVNIVLVSFLFYMLTKDDVPEQGECEQIFNSLVLNTGLPPVNWSTKAKKCDFTQNIKGINNNAVIDDEILKVNNNTYLLKNLSFKYMLNTNYAMHNVPNIPIPTLIISHMNKEVEHIQFASKEDADAFIVKLSKYIK